MQHFNSFFKDELTNMIALQFTRIVEETLNRNIAMKSSLMQVSPQGVFLNCTLTSEPVIKSNYIILMLDGSFVTEQTKFEIIKPATLPTHDETAGKSF